MLSGDVIKIRKETGMSQVEFARQFRMNLHTIRQWERKNSPLDSAVAAYLHCIQADANAILALLNK